MRSSLALLFCLLAIGLLSSQWGSKGQRLNAMLGCAALALADTRPAIDADTPGDTA